MKIDESMAIKFDPIDEGTTGVKVGSDYYEVSYRQLINEISKLRIRMINRKYKKNGSKKNQQK